MAKYTFINGMRAISTLTATHANGETEQVTLLDREIGSTKGVRYINVVLGGVGISTEQFSGYRAAELDAAWKAHATRIHQINQAAQVAAPAPTAEVAPKTAKTPKAGAVKELWSCAGGSVVASVEQTANPIYRIYIEGREAHAEALNGRNWRDVRAAIIGQAKQFAGVA